MDSEPVVPPRPDLRPDSYPDRVAEHPVRRRASLRFVAVVALFAVVGAGLWAIPLAVSPPRVGSASDYGFLGRSRTSGAPVRWNPCAQIGYVVNVARAPAGSIADVHEAVREVSVATRIDFRFEGFTDELPSEDRPGYLPDRYGRRWAPVLVAWVSPGSTDIAFTDGEHTASGVASPYVVKTTQGHQIVSGWIAINASDPNPPGFRGPGDQGPVLLHEWGHLMGLDHVDAEGALMDPRGGGMREFGLGDLEGLHRLGRESGCLPTPAPR